MKNIEQEVLTRLDAVAEKLGVKAEQLWTVVSKQVRVNMALNAMWAATAFLVCIASGVYLWWFIHQPATYSHLDATYPALNTFTDSYDDMVAGCVVAAAGQVAGIVVCISNLDPLIRRYLNPDYAALCDIFYRLRP